MRRILYQWAPCCYTSKSKCRAISGKANSSILFFVVFFFFVDVIVCDVFPNVIQYRYMLEYRMICQTGGREKTKNVKWLLIFIRSLCRWMINSTSHTHTHNWRHCEPSEYCTYRTAKWQTLQYSSCTHGVRSIRIQNEKAKKKCFFRSLRFLWWND